MNLWGGAVGGHCVVDEMSMLIRELQRNGSAAPSCSTRDLGVVELFPERQIDPRSVLHSADRVLNRLDSCFEEPRHPQLCRPPAHINFERNRLEQWLMRFGTHGAVNL